MALQADVEVSETGEHGRAKDNTYPARRGAGGIQSRLSARIRWVLLLLVVVLSLGGYVAVLQVSNANRPPGAYVAYVVLFVPLFLLYIAACSLVLTDGGALATRPALVLIGVVGIVARFLLVPAPPTLSNDVYRYVWDGRVAASHTSPYRYPPEAPQLAPLRSAAYDREIWQYINRKGAITIYPPGAELFYTGVHAIFPGSVAAMKAAMVLVDLASCAALALLLSLLRMPPTRVIVYAWSPLPIIEFGSSGHVEALSVFWTALALIFGVLAVKRYAGLPHKFSIFSLLASLCLGVAVLVKLIPVLLLAGWVRRFGPKMVAVVLALFGVVSIVFIETYGGYVSPLLATYLGSESSNAPFFYLLKYGVTMPLGIPDVVLRVLFGGLLVLFTLYILMLKERGPYDFIGKSFLLVAAYLWLATSAYAWYATWLLLFVPLFLPPNGLPLPGPAQARKDTPRVGEKQRYRMVFVAFAYTGLTFLGYLLFALPAPVSTFSMLINMH